MRIHVSNDPRLSSDTKPLILGIRLYETNYVHSQVITRLDELKVTGAMLQPLQHG